MYSTKLSYAQFVFIAFLSLGKNVKNILSVLLVAIIFFIIGNFIIVQYEKIKVPKCTLLLIQYTGNINCKICILYMIGNGARNIDFTEAKKLENGKCKMSSN